MSASSNLPASPQKSDRDSHDQRRLQRPPRNVLFETFERRLLLTAVGVTEVECPPADPPPIVELP